MTQLSKWLTLLSWLHHVWDAAITLLACRWRRLDWNFTQQSFKLSEWRFLTKITSLFMFFMSTGLNLWLFNQRTRSDQTWSAPAVSHLIFLCREWFLVQQLWTPKTPPTPFSTLLSTEWKFPAHYSSLLNSSLLCWSGHFHTLTLIQPSLDVCCPQPSVARDLYKSLWFCRWSRAARPFSGFFPLLRCFW